ncbi:MAG: hypothetical protein ACE5NG_16530, partial [bacterium]
SPEATNGEKSGWFHPHTPLIPGSRKEHAALKSQEIRKQKLAGRGTRANTGLRVLSKVLGKNHS